MDETDVTPTTNEELALDQGTRKKAGGERMCAVSRRVRPTDELIRFVLGPDDRVVPDVKRRLPGRGLWISASRSLLAEAVRRGIFAKGFGKAVRGTETLVEETETSLVRNVVEALAMAAKAGQVVSGFAKVEASLRKGEAAALIHAADGAKDGVRKLDGVLAQSAEAGSAQPVPSIPIVNALASAELDLALNRANVIHAALLAGPAGKTFLSRIERLVRFRTSEGGETANEISGTKARQLGSEIRTLNG